VDVVKWFVGGVVFTVAVFALVPFVRTPKQRPSRRFRRYE
jgi:hypothetical protein